MLKSGIPVRFVLGVQEIIGIKDNIKGAVPITKDFGLFGVTPQIVAMQVNLNTMITICL